MNLYWLEQTRADVPEGDAWLSAAETLHQEGLRFAKRRNDWRLGRWTAKLALAAHHTLPLSLAFLRQIELRPDSTGAPFPFIANEPAAVTISLSHRAGSALFAIAPLDAAMGCDLEEIEPHSAGFFDDYFTSQEQAWIAKSPQEHHPLLTTLVWSAKESALKALRVGLRANTRSVVVSAVDSGSASLTDANGQHANADIRWYPLNVGSEDGSVFPGWWRRDGKFVHTVLANPAPELPIPLGV